MKCCLVQSTPDLHQKERAGWESCWVTGIQARGMILSFGTTSCWKDWDGCMKFFVGGESSLACAASAELGVLKGARDGRLLPQAKMKGAG